MGNAGAIAEAGVKNVVDGRMTEKKSMQVRGLILASYISDYLSLVHILV